jgi:hypothetical protein
MFMLRGVSFLVPNEYGRYLAEILEPFYCSKYNWKLECSTEIWKKKNGQQDVDLFDDVTDIVDGEIFGELIKNNIYYVIFATLKAFPKNAQLSRFNTYQEFLQSDCELCLLIADCSYVEIYCKNSLLIDKLFKNAEAKGYEQVQYIDEKNDYRTKMCV